VHARATGHPVVGDVKYSTPQQQARAAELGVRRMCLHAEELVVVRHGRKLKLQAPIPEDFALAWDRLASAGS
jgi:23S rRNA pseudouridine955/2504/2580 synthase